MKAYVKIPMLAILMALSFSSCSKDEKNEVVQQPAPQSINVEDADALSQALTIDGAVRHAGALPSPAAHNGDYPTIRSQKRLHFINNGDRMQIVFDFEPTSSNHAYAGCFIQVKGASDYFEVKSASAVSPVKIPIELPSKMKGSSFVVEYCAIDTQGNISKVSSLVVGLKMINQSSAKPGIEPASQNRSYYDVKKFPFTEL